MPHNQASWQSSRYGENVVTTGETEGAEREQLMVLMALMEEMVVKCDSFCFSLFCLCEYGFHVYPHSIMKL